MGREGGRERDGEGERDGEVEGEGKGGPGKGYGSGEEGVRGWKRQKGGKHVHI